MHALKVGLTFRLPGPLVEHLRERFPAVGFAGPGLDTTSFDTSHADILLGWPKADFVRTATALKWIQLFAAGTDIVDFDDVNKRGIIVTNARGVGSPSIAEHVLAMMLHFNRRLGVLVRAQIGGTWIEKNSFDYPELGGQVLTVVGAGSIGSEIAKRAKAFGMLTYGINRDGRPVVGFDNVVEADAGSDVLQAADHVVACVSGVEANAHMIDATWLSQMKAGAHFYNVGRGGTVDENALLAALDDDRVGGAGLDVTDIEPLPAGHTFWTHPKVLLTQHKAMNSRHYWERLTQLFADNLERFLKGRPLVNNVHA